MTVTAGVGIFINDGLGLAAICCGAGLDVLLE